MKTSSCIKLLLALLSPGLFAAGQQMEPKYNYGMKIQGMYIQSVLMNMDDPDAMKQNKHMMPKDADIHLELRLSADENNPYGFAASSFIPYAKVDYRIEREGSDWFTSGTLMPMVANDGPHYGSNIKLKGIGKYKIKFRISPPQIMFHTDKETGAKKWWKPFILDWDMVYTGVGKKGGY